MRLTVHTHRIAIAAAALAFAATAAAIAAESTAPISTPVLRTARTATDQRIWISPHPDVIVSLTTIPVGGRTPVHKHPYQRFVYVLAGALRVTAEATGESRDYKPGDFIAEMREQFHFGSNTGAEPVKLLVIDQVPAGATSNMAMK